MLVVIRHFVKGKGAISLSEIKQALNLPTRIVNSVLRSLVEAGLLIELPSEGKEFEEEFVPAKEVSTFTIYNILEAVEQSGSVDLDLNSSAELQEVSVELERIKSEARASEQNLKMVDIQTSKQ
jgi:membrane protein